MKALVYNGPGKRALEEKPKPVITASTDAIVKITKTTICGTDQLNLDKRWSQNITLTTRLVDTVTTPMLLKTVLSARINPKQLITHHFELNDLMRAYDTFGHAGKAHALKVMITHA